MRNKCTVDTLAASSSHIDNVTNIKNAGIDPSILIALCGLLIAIISLIATICFFYYQTCKANQHQSLNEVIKRIEIIVLLVNNSYKVDENHYQLYSDFAFQSQLLRSSIEKFNQSEPFSYIKSLSKKHRNYEKVLIDKLNAFIEDIELKTPIEAPSNYDIKENDARSAIRSEIDAINTSASFIIKTMHKRL